MPQQRLVHKGDKIKNWGAECRDVTPTKSLSQNIRVDVIEELKFLGKFKKKIRGGGCFFFVGGGGGFGFGGGVRVDVNEELKFFENSKQFFFLGGGVRGVGMGVRMDVNEELKFL